MVKRRQEESEGGGAGNKRRVRFAEGQDEGFEETKGEPSYDARADDDDGEEAASTALARAKPGTFDQDDDDDEEDTNVGRMTQDVEGEEEDGDEKFNEAGEVLEPFNLKNERQEGYFDTNGNFVWKMQDQETDAWLAGLDDAAMEEAIGQAQQAQQRKDKEDAAQASASERDPLTQLDKSELALLAARLIEPGETVLKALKRLGNASKRAGPGKGAGRGKTKGGKPLEEAGESTPQQKEDAARNKAAFERLTDLADHLMQRGLTEVYYSTKEALQDMGKDEDEATAGANGHAAQGAAGGQASMYFSAARPQAGDAAAQATAAAQAAAQQAAYAAASNSSVQFEYLGKDGQVHGPFSMVQMYSWVSSGYFSGDNVVKMRPITPVGTAPTAAGTEATTTGDAAAELLADLDDDEEDKPGQTTPAQAQDASSQQAGTAERGEWVTSDAVDFSKYIHV